MECLTTPKDLTINYKRNIGTVVVIVEGSHDEFLILKTIFRDILHYRYIEKSRNSKKFKDYDEFIMKGNESSKVIAINLKNSNISSINDEEYKNEIFKMLYLKYNIDANIVPIYFLWDRDESSNDYNITKDLVSSLTSAYGKSNEEMNGLLLLSYPSIESFIVTNFDQKVENIQLPLKKYIKAKKYNVTNINKNTLLKSVAKMHETMQDFGIKEYDPANFFKENKIIFRKEEQLYQSRKSYKILSLIMIMLIDLNIITIKTK